MEMTGTALETTADDVRAHVEVNVIGTLVLFQATYPLLKASTPSPKFIPISASSGSIEYGTRIPINILSYGLSKAAQNYLARKIHAENDGLSTC
jgi:NAD(P)-dependent dehydrogenase (short-subunit alcohol dehydrogenase family)